MAASRRRRASVRCSVVVDVKPAWLGLCWLPSLGMLTLVLLLSVLVLDGLALLITPAFQLKQEPEPEPEHASEPEPEPEFESESALVFPPGVLDVAMLDRDATSCSPPSADRHSGHSRRCCRSVCLASPLLVAGGLLVRRGALAAWLGLHWLPMLGVLRLASSLPCGLRAMLGVPLAAVVCSALWPPLGGVALQSVGRWSSM